MDFHCAQGERKFTEMKIKLLNRPMIQQSKKF